MNVTEGTYVRPDPALVVFDLDATIIEPHVTRTGPRGESGEFVELRPFGEVVLMPGRREKIQALLGADVKVAIATNKAGVAWGHITLEDCAAKRLEVCRQLGVTDVDWQVGRFAWFEAYGHPDSPDPFWAYDDPDRKPKPGMLLRAMVALGEEPSTCLMVGDLRSDQEAAWRAGMPFKWADEYFGDRQEEGE